MKPRTVCLILLVTVTLDCFSQGRPGKTSYHAGYKTIHAVDRTRIYQPGLDTASLHFRPVDLDIWYPAKNIGPASAMTVMEYLQPFVSRPRKYSGNSEKDGGVNEMAKALCSMNHCSDSARLLQFASASYKNASPATGKFPLVVYLPSFGSNSFENYPLFEQLARSGTMVVAVNSLGRYPGQMTTQYDDLIEQVKDAVFAVQYLRKDSNLDTANTGIMGYSWGGLAGTILSGQITGVKCILSLDGSEFHHFGSDKIDDANFDRIAADADFTDIKMPYLRLEQNPPGDTSMAKDSVGNLY